MEEKQTLKCPICKQLLVEIRIPGIGFGAEPKTKLVCLNPKCPKYQGDKVKGMS